MRKKFISILLSALFVALPITASAAEFCTDDLPFNGNVIFLGDSTTNAIRHHELLPGGKNTASVWSGVDGTLSMWDVSRKEIGITEAMHTTYTKRRNHQNYKNIFKQIAVKNNPSIIYATKLPDLCEFVRPTAIVITLGINGCTCMSEDDFKYEYSALVDTVKSSSPDTFIVLNSIYPVSKSCAKISNDDVDRANKWIAQVASEHKVLFIDTNRLLKDEFGCAPEDLIFRGDGIHWTRKGCEKVLSLICSEINREI